MRCSEFRDLHQAYVDDTLAGVELLRVQRHIAECPECAEHDTRVRRAMMLVRSLPPIEPSPDFARRLEARLAQCREGREPRSSAVWGSSFRTVATVGAVASLAMLIYTADMLHTPGEQPHDVVLPPVMMAAAAGSAGGVSRDTIPALDAMATGESGESGASRAGAPALTDPAPLPSPAPAIVASVSTGVPIWPVALLTEPGTGHFATYTEGH